MQNRDDSPETMMTDVGPATRDPEEGARREGDPVGTLRSVPDLSGIKFDSRGLVPCIVQEWNTGEVLMLAYMNQESLRRTFESGTTWFYSRSRAELWNKGATSGHVQRVREVRYDCDGDTLLALVEQTGVACHTGDFTCFDGRWLGSPAGERPPFFSRRER